MPLGVPSVPYNIEGEDEEEWIDLYNRLSREKILFLCSEVSDETSNQLVGLFVYLNSENPRKEFYLYINSQGGSLICGLALYDVITLVHGDVSTIVVGSAASIASLVLTAGTIGKRIALPHTRIMIHQPESGASGNAIDIQKETDEVLRLKNQVLELYSERTNQPLSRIAKDFERDYFMSAQEAKKYNIVDAVVQSLTE